MWHYCLLGRLMDFGKIVLNICGSIFEANLIKLVNNNNCKQILQRREVKCPLNNPYIYQQ